MKNKYNISKEDDDNNRVGGPDVSQADRWALGTQRQNGGAQHCVKRTIHRIDSDSPQKIFGKLHRARVRV